MSEFDLIRRYLTRATPNATLGVGDDAALLNVSSDMELAVSTDMLVSGTHFLPDTDPFMLGHKTLAVNLSDMAAMGAQPRWIMLAMSLPEADERWLERFSAGFFALADVHHMELIGGDTTRGPLNMCVTVMGEVPQGAALRRDGAQIDDDVWVSGRLGDAALALAHLKGRVLLTASELEHCAVALHQPVPRVSLGLALRGIAHSAIDVSDGLLADLGHILESSGLGAELECDALPLSTVLKSYFKQALVQHCVLAGGDDYELCFTAATGHRIEVDKISAKLDVQLTRIGKIVAGRDCVVRSSDGGVINIKETGYDHFS